jgi:hypothetical protein
MFTNKKSVARANVHLAQLVPDIGQLTSSELIERLGELGHLAEITESYNNPLRPFVEQLAAADQQQYCPEEIEKHQYRPGINVEDMIKADANWYLSVYRANSIGDDIGYTIAKKLNAGSASAYELIQFLGEIHALEAWMRAVFLKSFLASIQ